MFADFSGEIYIQTHRARLRVGVPSSGWSGTDLSSAFFRYARRQGGICTDTLVYDCLPI